jgi:hypothetical protein
MFKGYQERWDDGPDTKNSEMGFFLFMNDFSILRLCNIAHLCWSSESSCSSSESSASSSASSSVLAASVSSPESDSSSSVLAAWFTPASFPCSASFSASASAASLLSSFCL